MTTTFHTPNNNSEYFYSNGAQRHEQGLGALNKRSRSIFTQDAQSEAEVKSRTVCTSTHTKSITLIEKIARARFLLFSFTLIDSNVRAA